MDHSEGTLFYHSILSRIQGQIEAQARNLHARIHNAISISLDDLIQEGMIGAWKGSLRYDESLVKDEESINGYCMKWARGEMLYFIKTCIRKYKQDTSLEEYLEIETEGCTKYGDMEDTRTHCTKTESHKRAIVMSALRHLCPNQRMAVMAAFQIEDDHGNIIEKEGDGQVHKHRKYRGLKSLSLLLNGEDLRGPVGVSSGSVFHA